MIPVPPPVDLDAALADYAVEQCAAERVEVHALPIAPHLVRPTDGVVFTGDPCRARPVLRLEVHRDGAVAARYTVQPRLTAYVRVSVTADPLERGDIVSELDTTAVVAAPELVGAPVGEGRWEARRALPAGTPLTDAVLRPARDAHAGDRVEVVVRRGELVIGTRGRLLSAARIGDRVRVHSDATGTTVSAVLVEPGVVEVR